MLMNSNIYYIIIYIYHRPIHADRSGANPHRRYQIIYIIVIILLLYIILLCTFIVDIFMRTEAEPIRTAGIKLSILLLLYYYYILYYYVHLLSIYSCGPKRRQSVPQVHVDFTFRGK